MINIFLNIYGDNIVECERAYKLFKHIIEKKKKIQEIILRSPAWSPIFRISFDDINIDIQFFTDANKHEYKPIDKLQKMGSPLYEGVDAIITRRTMDEEKIILCIEWTSAIPAGNQAWQHCGRMWSINKTGIPVIQFVQIFGGELDPEERILRSLRIPSPILIWSYLSLLNDSRGNAMTFWVPSPMSAYLDPQLPDIFFKDFDDLDEYLYNLLICNTSNNISEYVKIHNKNILKLVVENTLKPAITIEEIDKICELNNKKDRLEYIKNRNIPWRPKTPTEKTAGLSDIWKKTMCILLKDWIPKHGIAPLQTDLPWGIIKQEKIMDVASTLKKIDGDKIGSNIFNCGSEIFKWFENLESDIGIVYMSGWKESGGDPRPPRGLLPFSRMILGDEIPIFTIMTGPGHRFDGNNPYEPVKEWDLIHTEEGRNSLSKSSGYWKPLFYCSNAILITHEQASLHDKNFVRGIIIER